MFSNKSTVKQIAAKGRNGSSLFPVNPTKMSLNKKYLINGEEITEHTTAFGVQGAKAEMILNVTHKTRYQ